MSAVSKIEWTDATWNPTTGCTKVSPGCDFCYAERQTERFHGLGSFEKVVLHPERIGVPLRWRKPRKVFVDSMSDLLHADVPDDFIARVFVVMAATPQHTYQILTKRHGRMRSLLSSPEFQVLAGRAAFDFIQEHKRPVGWTWPPPNVWLGVSVEDQKHADLRVPALRETPAAVRFLSCEPLLGPLEELDLNGIGWVIVGGESGPKARPMNPDWARSVVQQCQSAGVPVFVKQDSGPKPGLQGRIPDELWIKEFPDVA